MRKIQKLTQLEYTLLRLVAKGRGQWSWYELANRLANMDVPRDPDMMDVLQSLVQRGFLARYTQRKSPRDRWVLTLNGHFVLRGLQSQQTNKRFAVEVIEPKPLQDTVPIISRQQRRVASTSPTVGRTGYYHQQQLAKQAMTKVSYAIASDALVSEY